MRMTTETPQTPDAARPFRISRDGRRVTAIMLPDECAAVQRAALAEDSTMTGVIRRLIRTHLMTDPK